MMAVMDVEPHFRWCVDFDHGGGAARLVVMMRPLLSLVGVVGWFSISDPTDAREVLTLRMSVPVLGYGGNVDLGCRTLEEFLAGSRVRVY